MNQVKWKASLSIFIVMVMLIVQGCAQGNQETKVTPASANNNTSNAPITITWWHSMGGELGKAIDQIVTDYNASQSKVIVKAAFQGSYEESLSKMKASFDSKNGPSFIQVNEVGSRFMLDSKATTPVQSFIDKEKYDTSQLEGNIIDYYKMNGQLNSMPFNTSNPVLYYNKDIFKAAGLDPEKPPATFEELTKAAAALTKNGVTGLGFFYEGWYMEQNFAKQGAVYVNNDNGRTGLATESYLNKEAGVSTLTWWKSLVDNKLALNFGRTGDDAKKAFLSGQVAMMMNSSGGLRGIVDSAKGKFEVGVGYLPKPESTKDGGGVIIGGGSNWILNNKSEDEQNAAWDFIKFLTSTKEQAFWSVSSGYFPVTKKAYDEQIVKDNLVKYPQFITAIDQLHQTKSSYATQGAVMGVFHEQRLFVSTAIEEALNGTKTPQEALDIAAANSTKAMIKYNQMNK
jgi:sn-glycerol 3-phosphate transport system substrate-binding protein